MNKIQEFLKQEKEFYGKSYIDINYAIDAISPFLEPEILKSRKYISILPILKKYMDLITSAEAELSKERTFFFSSDKYSDLLKSYKKDHQNNFKQIQLCSTCACLNCTADCKFDSCLGCKSGAHIAYCDHVKINVIVHDNYTLNLTNDRTGERDHYTVLATLQDVEKNQHYIIIENLESGEKFILYYYPGINEDTYGSIEDGEEFDFIVSTFNNLGQYQN